MASWDGLFKYDAYEQIGDQKNAEKYYQMAAEMPPDLGFPFRLEMIEVLAPYYLGNLLYDSQPEEAIREWDKAKDLGSKHPIVFRNLGMAYDKSLNNLEMSMKYYEKAIELNPEDSRVIFELEDVYKAAQEPTEKRLALLQKYHENIVNSGYLLPLEREIELYVLMGQYDTALELMGTYQFRRWEGRGNVYTSFVSANLLRGEKNMNIGQFEKALGR